MTESRKTQFIMLEFPFIDSELYDEWDPRGMKLYWKMRRYVCRSSNHRLAGYWHKGILAVEGFLGTWAKSLGVSKSMVSKLLKWMEKKDILVCTNKSCTAGDPNVYALGRVYHVEGSDKTVEVFFLDFHYQAEAKSMIPFESDTSLLDPVTALDVPNMKPPTKLNTVLPEKQTVHGGKHSVHGGKGSVPPGKQSVSGGERSNIEDRISEEGIDKPTPQAAEPDPPDEPKPKEEKPVPVPETAEPWEGKPPPAARVYQECIHRWPRRNLYRMIHNAVGNDRADLEFWGEVVTEYNALGWNPVNVAGMLEWYGRREIPHVQRSNGNNRHGRNQAILDKWKSELCDSPGEGEYIDVEYHVIGDTL